MATAILIAGGLYGYGETRDQAWFDFQRQISGAPAWMQGQMNCKAREVALTDDEASEVAAMLDAPILGWVTQ